MSTDLATDNAFWDEQFHRTGRESYIWFLRAQELKRAADLLEPFALADQAREFSAPSTGAVTGRPVMGPYMLLAGLAIESLAKAILIDRAPGQVRDGRLKPWGRRGHDLPALCERIGIPWTASEINLFIRLADAVTWTAKYPIPLTAAEMMPRLNSDGQMVWRGGMAPTDPSAIQQVWETLRSLVEELWLAARPQQAKKWRAGLVAEALGHRAQVSKTVVTACEIQGLPDAG